VKRCAVSERAKIFKHGRSQAVRLPKEFRFAGDEVRITKVGDRVILEPLEAPQAMPWALIDELSEGLFMPDGREQPPMPPERRIFSS
jgi:antitoxin VapB